MCTTTEGLREQRRHLYDTRVGEAVGISAWQYDFGIARVFNQQLPAPTTWRHDLKDRAIPECGPQRDDEVHLARRSLERLPQRNLLRADRGRSQAGDDIDTQHDVVSVEHETAGDMVTLRRRHFLKKASDLDQEHLHAISISTHASPLGTSVPVNDPAATVWAVAPSVV